MARYGGWRSHDKVLETCKLWRELQASRETEKEKDRMVQLATDDEIREYAQTPVERILKERYRKTGQYLLEPTRFVSDSREEKRP